MALWGKVLDQANIIKSSFDDLEKSVIKATRHDTSIPKEKHVRSLIIFTHERSSPVGQLVLHLSKRLEVPDWIIVLKSLIVFHRLFMNGNTRFVEDLKWRGAIFPLGRFNDNTSPEAYVQSVFIRKYAQYLEEKVAVYRELKVEFEKEPGLCKGLSIEESFTKLPKLQRQLDALINCQTSAEAITNVATALAFEQMLRDSFKLYRGLNDGIITLLETYFTLDRKSAIRALDIYKAFMRETSSIIAMYEMTKKRFTLEVPDLKHAPTTLVTSLEDYVKELEEGKTPEVRALAEEKFHRSPDKHHDVAHDTHEHTREHSERTKSEPKAPAPQFNLFDDDNTTVQGTQAPSLIDPFGVASASSGSFFPQQVPTQSFNFGPQQPTQARAPPAAFDPFGGDAFAFAPAPVASQPVQQPKSQAVFDPFASAPLQPTGSSTNYSSPFAGHQQQQPQQQHQQHQSYEEKAQNIKMGFTPTLQPTTSPNPFSPPTSAAPSGPYPKPNYNINVAPVASPPMTMVPYGMQYTNTPASGPGVVYGAPQQMGRQPSQPQPPFGMMGSGSGSLQQPTRNNSNLF